MDREDKAKQLIIDYMNTFTSESGKRVRENLSLEGYEKDVTFVKDDALGSAFNEGKRYMILHINRMLARKPDIEKQTEAV